MVRYNGTLTEEIYMEIPDAYDVDNNGLKLKKTLYGLKQSGRNWYEYLAATLRTLKLTQSQYNPCIFYLED